MTRLVALFYSFCDMIPNYANDEWETIITLELFAALIACAIIILEILLIRDKNSRKYGYLPDEYKYVGGNENG